MEECKREFPKNFVWSAGGASYQIEGATEAGGRQPSIWDTFCATHVNHECATVADLSYYLFPTDVQNVLNLNLKSYRFSISWSRVLSWNPCTKKMVPNEIGLAYYAELIKLLKANNIEPIVTIFHWDLPQALVDNLGGYTQGGWLSPEIVGYFGEYAKLLFTRFGRDVAYWITLNEPWSFLYLGYGIGVNAPGLSGSGTWEYIGAKYALLSHARAVEIFKDMRENGTIRADAKIMISLSVGTEWPLNECDPKDCEAAERVYEFTLGWFLRPLTTGEWPRVMKEAAGDRMPDFTPEESLAVKNSLDGIIGINYYTTNLCTPAKDPSTLPPGWSRDLAVNNSFFPKGAIESGRDANGMLLCPWDRGYPPGLRSCLRKIVEMGPGLNIFITENGFCASVSTPEQQYTSEKNMLIVLEGIVAEMYKAINNDKIPLIGYAAWSLMDNYEWGSYEPRFGLYRVDRDTVDLRRTPKPAAFWYADLVKHNAIPPIR